MAKAAAAGGVVSLFRRGRLDDDEPEVAVGLPPMTAAPAAKAAEAAPRAAVELAGPPVWFLIGPGGSGKTMWARWAAERAAAAGRDTVLAALDPTNRTLAQFFDGVEQPPSADAAATARWLGDGLEGMMEAPRPAVFDMGGGSTALPLLAERTPGLAATLEANGLGPVAAYFLGPRVDDLGTLAALERTGFAPRATVLALNMARVDATQDAAEAFGPVRRHSVFRAAVERGAAVVEMPRLDPDLALLIERRRLHFGAAADDPASPLGVFERSQVRLWRERMEAAFAPAAGWMP